MWSLVTDTNNLSRDDGVKRMGLMRLITRRLKSDLAELFKIIRTIYILSY